MAFHDARVANGGKSIEDPPGWREGTTGRFYLAFAARDRPGYCEACSVRPVELAIWRRATSDYG